MSDSLQCQRQGLQALVAGYLRLRMRKSVPWEYCQENQEVLAHGWRAVHSGIRQVVISWH